MVYKIGRLNKRDSISTSKTEYRRHPFSSENCGQGRSIPDWKGVGGKEAQKGEWPWMVQLSTWDGGSENRAIGSGVLISETHVLTAAHFFDRFEPG